MNRADRCLCRERDRAGYVEEREISDQDDDGSETLPTVREVAEARSGAPVTAALMARLAVLAVERAALRRAGAEADADGATPPREAT